MMGMGNEVGWKSYLSFVSIIELVNIVGLHRRDFNDLLTHCFLAQI